MAPENNRRKEKAGNGGDVAGALLVTVGIAIGAGLTWLYHRMTSAEMAPSADDGARAQQQQQQEVLSPRRFEPLRVEKAQPGETACAICMDNKPNCAFDPCNHMTVCSSCAEHCKLCPMCRKPITSRWTLFV